MKVLPLHALQTAGPSRGSDDHVEMAVPSPVGDVKIVSPISIFVLNTLTLKKKGGFFFFTKATNDRKQFQWSNIVLCNKTKPLSVCFR